VAAGCGRRTFVDFDTDLNAACLTQGNSALGETPRKTSIYMFLRRSSDECTVLYASTMYQRGTKEGRPRELKVAQVRAVGVMERVYRPVGGR